MTSSNQQLHKSELFLVRPTLRLRRALAAASVLAGLSIALPVFAEGPSPITPTAPTATVSTSTPTPPVLEKTAKGFVLQRPQNEYRVHTIDVDQGQSVLVQTLGGKNILMDTGEDYAADRLVSYLKKVGVEKIDYLVISHRHMDHMGGVPKVAAAFPVENVITPWDEKNVPKTALVWMASLRKDMNAAPSATNAPAFHTAVQGEKFDFGSGSQGEVLWPNKPTGGQHIGDYNEESVVMRIDQKPPNGTGKPASFVIGGDLGWQLEQHLAETVPGKLRADGLVDNHHGSGGSSDRAYLEAVRGGTTSLMRALDDPAHADPTTLKTAVRVQKLAERNNNIGKIMALKVSDNRIFADGKPDPTGKYKTAKIAIAVNQALKQGDGEGKYNAPWMTVSSGRDNPYNHPNGERMGLATELGYNVWGTQQLQNVVETKRVDDKGNWTSDNWFRARVPYRDLGLPGDVSSGMPTYKRVQDPKRPYNETARQANYIFALQHPDSTAPWTDRTSFLPAPGKTPTSVYMDIARVEHGGRHAFEEQERAMSKEELAKQASTIGTPWHGVKLSEVPWSQGADRLWNEPAGAPAHAATPAVKTQPPTEATTPRTTAFSHPATAKEPVSPTSTAQRAPIAATQPRVRMPSSTSHAETVRTENTPRTDSLPRPKLKP
jgi:beta-lactamase superfamily II metal-dependent hydrolase